ncbi:MAG: hypothetical protein V2J25_03645 [Desulfatiglans sp.]|jgi:hypothetical protein|nr:hypothetical protein [Thermodesulfobacteriota bacterium]MEE4351941.1 hypothetical protein [Desulfatiglans sp.]
MEKKDEILTMASSVCQGKLEVPTDKEVEALREMKAIKKRVRILKRRLDELAPSGDKEVELEQRQLKAELAGLKTKWDEWETKRQKAAKERMVLLGHEKGIEDPV